MGTIIKMFGTVAGGTQDALATIDVPMPGHLVGVLWSGNPDLPGVDFSINAQVSFRSVGALQTNDDRGIVSEFRSGSDLTTSGDAPTGVNYYHPLPDVPVMGGERLYLHTSSTASTAGQLAALLSFDFDLDKISVRRR